MTNLLGSEAPMRRLAAHPAWLRWLLIAGLLAGLSGCVWFRLLEMKSQLGEFDRYFRIESTDAFTLHFLEPVLYDDDYVELAKVKPTRVESSPGGNRWIQVFHKTGANRSVLASPPVDVLFTLEFDGKQRLKSWRFSPTFMAMVPARFLEASLRSLGKGKVDEGKKQLRVNPADLPTLNEKPPLRPDLLKTLGEPAKRTPDGDLFVDLYEFVTETDYVKPDYEDRKKAYAKLFYNAKDELQKVSGRFLGLKFSIDFRKLIKLEAAGKSN